MERSGRVGFLKGGFWVRTNVRFCCDFQIYYVTNSLTERPILYTWSPSCGHRAQVTDSDRCHVVNECKSLTFANYSGNSHFPHNCGLCARAHNTRDRKACSRCRAGLILCWTSCRIICRLISCRPAAGILPMRTAAALIHRKARCRAGMPLCGRSWAAAGVSSNICRWDHLRTCCGSSATAGMLPVCAAGVILPGCWVSAAVKRRRRRLGCRKRVLLPSCRISAHLPPYSPIGACNILMSHPLKPAGLQIAFPLVINPLLQ